MNRIPLVFLLALACACARREVVVVELPETPEAATAALEDLAPLAPAEDVASEASFTEAEIDAARHAFELLAEECGVAFTMPEGFTFLPGAEVHGLDHEATLIDDGGLLEVRLSLRSLKDAEVAYEDPHAAAPSPEHIYPLMFLAIVQAISKNPEAPSRGFGEAALGEYGADWGQASVLIPDPRYCGNRSSLLMIALHRRLASDVYMTFLYDDYEAVKDRIAAAKNCLKYLP